MTLARASQYDEEAIIPEELMRIVALYISVLDLPSFVLTSRWFARQAEKWWQFQVARVFDEHPPKLFPRRFSAAGLSGHGFFFHCYLSELNLFYRRRALLIRDGNIEQLKREIDKGIKIRNSTRHTGFNTFDLFSGYVVGGSLLAVAHSTSEINKKKAIDFFLEFIISKRELSKNRIKVLRNVLNLFPDLTVWQFDKIKTYVIINQHCSPILSALLSEDYASTLILLQCEADLDEPIEHRGISTLHFLISEVAKLVNSSLPSAYPPIEGLSGLISYCREHFGELLDAEISRFKKPRPST